METVVFTFVLCVCSLCALCEGTEYYVRASDAANASCPDQPCLTLAQYISDSDHYFKSNNNTVFWFLNGIHNISRPAVVTDAHNVTFKRYGLEGENPLVMFSSIQTCNCDPSHSSCVQCSVIQFNNVNMATVEGIAVIGTRYENSAINGITLERSNGSIVQDVSIVMKQFAPCGGPYIDSCGCSLPSSSYMTCGAIILSRTVGALLSDLVVNYSYINVDVSYDAVISNVTIYKSPDDGLQSQYSSNLKIQQAKVSFTSSHCIRLQNVYNTLVEHVDITGCGDDGFHIINSSNTEITTSHIQTIATTGISLDSGSRDTHIANSFIGHCLFSGIEAFETFNTLVENTTVINSSILCFGAINTTFIRFHTEASSGINMITAFGAVILNSTITIRQDTNNALSLSNSTDVMIKNFTSDASMSVFSGKQIVLSNIKVKSVSKPALVVYRSANVTIQNTHFEGIGQVVSDMTDHPAVLVLYQSTDIKLDNCYFSRNTISPLKVVGSNFTVGGTLVISSNTAPLGAAMILQQRSVMKLSNDSYLHFVGNHATSVGGAIYVDTNTFYTNYRGDTIVLNSECLFQNDSEVTGKRLLFYNNTAGSGGDVVYGGYMGLATSTDNSNCLLRFKSISQISGSNNLSAISSQPSRVCMCSSSTGQPDCLSIFHTHSVYPGETIYLRAVVVGQNFGTGLGSVYAHFLSGDDTQNPQLKQWQYSQGVSQKYCNQLNYSILAAPAGNIVLVLSSVEIGQVQHMVSNDTVNNALESYKMYLGNHGSFPQDLLNFPVYVNVSVRPCPVGFTLSTSPYTCECSAELRKLPGAECYIETQSFERPASTWIGFDKKKGVMVSLYCRYSHCRQSAINITVNTTDDQCSYNHSGILCGGCRPGLSQALGGNRCISCSNYYLFLIVPFALAGFILVLAIKFLDLTISNGYMNSIVFYVNVIHAIVPTFIAQGHNNPVPILVAWANLDLGIETCFFKGLSEYWKMWLQFVFPLYLWSISGMIILAAKYSTRMSQLMGSNPVSVLATLFLLSYAKLIQSSVLIMANDIVYYPHSQKRVWSLDGNIEYLGPMHLPLFIIAVAVLLLLCAPYTFVLLCGQWLYKCRSRFISRMMFRIKPFMDAYYGPLKDKHRYWVGFLMISRAGTHVALSLTPNLNATVVFLALLIMSIILLQLNGYVLGFYHNWHVTIFEVTLFSNLAVYSAILMYAVHMEAKATLITNIFFGVAVTQIIAFVLYRLLITVAKKVVPHGVMASITGLMTQKADPGDAEVKGDERPLISPTDSERILINSCRTTTPTYGI